MDKTCHIYVQNNFSSIVSENRVGVEKLKKALSRKVPGCEHSTLYRSGMWDGYTSFLKRGKFLSGILALVCFYLDELDIPYTITDERQDPCKTLHPVNLHGLEPRPYQWDAIASAIQHKRGVCGAATNAGKSLVAIGLTQSLNVPTLFLTHRKELFEQTVAEFEKLLQTEVGRIHRDRIDLDKQVTLAMVPTLQRRTDDPEVVRFLERVGLLVVDEGHHTTADTYSKIVLGCPNAYYRIGLSGTPQQDSSIKGIQLMGLLGQIIFEISNYELIQQGVSSKPNIILRSIKKPVLAKSFNTAYQKGIIENEERNSVILHDVQDFISRKLPTLIIVNQISHGHVLRKFLVENGVDEESCQFISGEQGKDEHRGKYFRQFKSGKLPVLITTLIIQEGISLNSVGALIFALGGKSNVRVLQCLGRGLRLNNFGNTVEVRDFLDNSHEYLLDHSLERYQMYCQDNMEEYVTCEPLWDLSE